MKGMTLMIVAEYANSTNITQRNLATPQTVYIAQAPDGLWTWHRRSGTTLRTGRERFANETAALHAAADIATAHGAKLKVSPWQQARIIAYWYDKGAQAFRAGAHVHELANRHMAAGWMAEAESEALRRESESKPGLDAPQQLHLTLEEALELQIRANDAQIQANRRLLEGVGA